MTAPNGVGIDVRKSKMPHIALPDQLANRADRLLDRNVGIETDLIEVDIVGFLTSERISESVL